MNTFTTLPTRKILDGLNRPDQNLKIIHIAGTNGKGSTAAYFTSILVKAGYRTGTFVSPETYTFYDQFLIDGVPISEELFNSYLAEAKKYACGASEFEINTAAAIYAFYKEGCKYAVLECGMGGRDDATNAVLHKQLAVITSISSEHTAFLGNTLGEICAHKSGIITDCPAVINACQPREVKEYFSRFNCIFADKLEDIKEGGFIYDGQSYNLKMHGSLQPYNAACAIEGARLLGINDEFIRAGIENAFIGGRIEVIKISDTTYILDGAHNPAAFRPLREFLKEYKRDRIIIFGCLNDKDMHGNLRELSSLSDKLFAVKCPSPRASDLNLTARACKQYFNNVYTYNSVEEALAAANCREVVVCGSFTLLKGARQWISKRQ